MKPLTMLLSGRTALLLGSAATALALLAPAAAHAAATATGADAGAPAADAGAQESAGAWWELDVRVETLPRSVHKKLSCSQCHANLEGRKVGAGVSTPAEKMCRGCHVEADKAYEASAHGASLREGKPGAARCQDCHGAHDVFHASERGSRLQKRNVVATCLKCHQNPYYRDQFEAQQQIVEQYEESIHGRALVKNGMVKAPSCTDCHGGHGIAAVKDSKSAEHKTHVVAMCVGCHAGVTETFAKSAHGAELAKGNKDAPSCQSCHSAHAVMERGTSFKLASDRQCGACHEKRMASHLATYHGRAHALGGAEVAACYDCHGTHQILGAKNAASMVNPANRSETCTAKCHAGAPSNLVGYLPHGNPDDRGSYPLLYWTYKPMRWLIGIAFGLFALHALTWAGRNVVAWLDDRRSWREARARRLLATQRAYPELVRGVDAVCYVLMLVCLVIMLGTGLPLGFPRASWASWLFGLLGGADMARSFHRFGAMLTLVYVTLHIATMIAPLWRARAFCRDEEGRLRWRFVLEFAFGPDSPLPNRRDVAKLRAHLKWLVGRGPEPTFERYPYWEKLDYLAMLSGFAVIGATGFVRYAPGAALRGLPGWAINVAQIIHREQAWLVLLFIATAHVVHVLPRMIGAPRRNAFAAASRRGGAALDPPRAHAGASSA